LPFAIIERFAPEVLTSHGIKYGESRRKPAIFVLAKKGRMCNLTRHFNCQFRLSFHLLARINLASKEITSNQETLPIWLSTLLPPPSPAKGRKFSI